MLLIVAALYIAKQVDNERRKGSFKKFAKMLVSQELKERGAWELRRILCGENSRLHYQYVKSVLLLIIHELNCSRRQRTGFRSSNKLSGLCRVLMPVRVQVPHVHRVT